MNKPVGLTILLLALLVLVLAGCDLGQSEPAATPPVGATAQATSVEWVPPVTGTSQPIATEPARPLLSETIQATFTPERAYAPGVTPSADNGSATLPVLTEGWTRIEPGGDTSCARGTPYYFWVRPGKVNRLLVYFEGGGGCWNYETCKEGSTYFDDTLNARDDPTYRPGVFDLENPSNPFKDYYAVYVPYCTGDVHWGNNVITYTSDTGDELLIRHKGFVNATSAMNWTYANFSGPESIFVTGCSAGSIGSIIFAPYLAQHYSQAQLDQLGDSEAFVFDHPLNLDPEFGAYDNIPPWIPGLQETAKSGQLTMAGFYSGIANFYPDHTFSQYNTAHDPVQQRYYFAAARTPTPEPWENALESSLTEIRESAPNFRSFVAAGDGHCITPFAQFYTEQTEGVLFRDWVADMAAGKDVPNVHCTDCEP